MVNSRIPQDDLEAVFLLHPENREFLNGTRSTIQTNIHGFLPFFAMIFTLTSFLIAILVLQHWHHFIVLTLNGEYADAQVTEKWVDTQSDSDIYFADVNYTIGQTNYSGRLSVTAEQYFELNAGDLLLITYAQSDETIITLGDPSLQQPGWLTVFFFIWLTLSSYAFVMTFRAWLKGKRLARKGEIVLGQAVSSELDRDSDGDVQLKIVYQFISPHTDTMLTGYSYAQRNDISHEATKRSPDAPIPAQKPVAILYHQDNDYLIL